MSGTRTAEGKLVLTLSGSIKNTLPDEQVATCPFTGPRVNIKLESGLGTEQFDRAWEDLGRTLVSGGHHEIDLYDFTGENIGANDASDGLGLALVMKEIVAVAIVHDGGAGSLEITPDAVNGWTPIGSHTVALGGALKEGGILFKAQPHTDGFAVTDASNNVINLKAVGGAVEYSVYVWGRSDTDESSSSSSSSVSSNSSSTSASSSSSTSFSSSSSSTSSVNSSSSSSSSSSTSTTSASSQSSSSSSSS